MKSVNLSVLPNYVVWFVGVDVEFVLSCRSDPLGRDGDESEQEHRGLVSDLFRMSRFFRWEESMRKRSKNRESTQSMI